MKTTQRFLAIETSSPRLSLAVGTEAGVIKEYQGPLEWRHAETLFDAMQKLLGKVGWPVQSLSGVMVSTGPGSFTGIRIGLAAARALGQSLDIPVIGISSLETLAAGALPEKGYVCPVIDALRGEVFAGLYTQNTQGKLRTLWKEGRWPVPDLLRKLKPFLKGPLLFVGDAAAIHKKVFQYPQARILLERGWEKRQQRSTPYHSVMPLYLRSAAAVERRKR